MHVVRQRRRDSSPRSLQERFLDLVDTLPRRIRLVVLLLTLTAIAFLTVWATLPDKTKERLLAGASHETLPPGRSESTAERISGVQSRSATTRHDANSSISANQIDRLTTGTAQDAPTTETSDAPKPTGKDSLAIELPHSDAPIIHDDGLVLELTDKTGSVLTIKQADSYFESTSPVGLGTNTRRSGGIEVRRGAGTITINWTDISKVDISMRDYEAICIIRLRNKTTVSAACSSDLKIGGSADLGFYEVTLGDLKSLRVMSPGP